MASLLVGFFRKIVYLTANSLILIGLLMFIYGLYILSLIFLKDYKGFFVYDSEFGMFAQQYGFLILGGIMMLFGVFGFLGSLSEDNHVACKRAFLFLYHLGSVFFTVFFISISFVLLYYAKQYFEEDCQATQQFQELTDGVTKANILFCSIGCPCYLDSSQFTDKTVLIGRIGQKNSNLPIQVQQCSLYDSKQYALPSQFMNILENKFKCSGWCKSTSIYLFSDVTNGNTNGISCFDRFKEYYQSYFKVIGYISLGLGILFFISLIFMFSLYCIIQRENKSKHTQINMQLLLRE